MVGALSDALATPQLHADLKVGEAHGADWYQVCQDSEKNVVSALD